MAYFSYHAIAKKLIREGHLVSYQIMNAYNKIAPALILFFDNHIPMPIREYRWDEYIKLIEKIEQKKTNNF